MEELEQKKPTVKDRLRDLEDKIAWGTEMKEDVELYEKLKKLDIMETKEENDQELKEKESLWVRILKLAEVVGSIGVSAGGIFLYKKMYEEGLKFEETGTFTSFAVKDLFRRVKTK